MVGMDAMAIPVPMVGMDAMAIPVPQVRMVGMDAMVGIVVVHQVRQEVVEV
jgi:hypothetical protein